MDEIRRWYGGKTLSFGQNIYPYVKILRIYQECCSLETSIVDIINKAYHSDEQMTNITIHFQLGIYSRFSTLFQLRKVWCNSIWVKLSNFQKNKNNPQTITHKRKSCIYCTILTVFQLSNTNYRNAIIIENIVMSSGDHPF